jgi:hypothetical protein
MAILRIRSIDCILLLLADSIADSVLSAVENKRVCLVHLLVESNGRRERRAAIEIINRSGLIRSQLRTSMTPLFRSPCTQQVIDKISLFPHQFGI